jgi:ABC-type sugar transport system substrate-binding protein
MVGSGNNAVSAEETTNKLVDLLTEKYGEPKGKVLAMIASPEIETLRIRHEVMRDIFAEYPNIEVIEKIHKADAQDSVTVLQNALTADPDIDAVWNTADWWSANWIEALKEIDKLYPVGDEKHLIICSQDGWDFVLDNIRNKHFDSTFVANLDHWGWWPIWGMAQYFAGVDLNSLVGFTSDDPQVIIQIRNDTVDAAVGGVMTTIDNVDNPNIWGNNMDKFEETQALLEKGTK